MAKKILILHPYLTPYRIDLYNYLSTIHQLNVFLYANKKERSTLGFDLKLLNSKAKFYFRYFENGIYLGRHNIGFSFCNNIFKQKPDIIFAHELGFNLIVSLFLKFLNGTKVYTTIDDSPEIFIKRGFFKRYLLYIVSKYVTFCVVNPDVINLIKKRAGKRFYKAIYLPLLRNEENLYSEFPFLREKGSKTGNILFVGRLIREKRPLVLLEAILILKLKNVNVSLSFVGNGVQENELKLLTKKYCIEDRVEFNGQLSGSKLFEAYHRADVFVLPSYHEPFGAVVGEALMCSCYVIVSNSVGSSCLVNTTNGRVLSNTSAIEIANTIDEYYNNKSLQKKPNNLNFNYLIKVMGDEF